jgi:hypothetical protein
LDDLIVLSLFIVVTPAMRIWSSVFRLVNPSDISNGSR